MRLARARSVRLVALVSVLAVALAACGSGRNNNDNNASGSNTTAGGNGSGGGSFNIDTSNCTTDPSKVQPTGDTIKLGTSLPQSGLYAPFTEILRGEQAYFSYLNATQGGVEIAGKKYKVELDAKDDQYDAQKTFANVQSLVETDKVFALFNVVGTKNNLAIRDYLNTNCVPDLYAASGALQWGNHQFPWLIGTGLVPYGLEMKALVEYLNKTNPTATIAILRASDDFGASYSETLQSLVKGTKLKIVATKEYDPETGDVTSQITSLAASKAQVFVLGATLLACPQSLNQVGASGWKPLVYMSGTCTSKTLMNAAGANGNNVLSVAPIMDPNDPKFASNPAMQLYKTQVPKYAKDADVSNGIVAYGWSTAALFADMVKGADAPNRLAIMKAARTQSDIKTVGLQLPDTTWAVGANDWFIAEQFALVQYSTAAGYFKTVGDLYDFNGQTADIVPSNLING